MKKAIILAALALVFSAGFVFAQEEATETATPVPEAVTQAPVEYLYPGILPDHPLYFLKNIFYNIRGLFVFGDEAKARWHLKLADKRAAEARELARKGKDILATRASEKAVAMRDKAIGHIKKAKAAGKDVRSLVEKLEAVSVRQQVVLERVLEKVPEEAKEAVKRAKERSRRGLERAIEVLREEPREATPAAEEAEETPELEEEAAAPGRGRGAGRPRGQ